MQFAWFHWWWEPTGLDRAQVVLGVLGILLAATAVIYAWRVAAKQFALMNEQGKIIDKQLALLEEQTRAAKRLEAMTDEQGVIMKRQGEVAEMMREQLARVAKLEVKLFRGDGPGGLFVGVVNSGNKVARDFYWRLLIPIGMEGQALSIVESDGRLEREEMLVPPERYLSIGQLVTKPLYPGKVVLCGKLIVSNPSLLMQPRNGPDGWDFRWSISSDEGHFPHPFGYGVIQLIDDNPHAELWLQNRQ